MTEVVALPDAEAAAHRVAEDLARRFAGARPEAELHVALAGGATPRRAYELLGTMEGAWAHVHLWLGDERCVPRHHPDSNARMVEESLFVHARAHPPRLHRVAGGEVPEDAAWLYGRELAEAVPGPVFDVVLLGLGEDGHTASLFPGHPALDAVHAPCVPVRAAPRPPPQRVTLGLPLLREARHTMLLVVGEAKRAALGRALAGPDRTIPASLLGDGLDQVVCDAPADPR